MQNEEALKKLETELAAVNEAAGLIRLLWVSYVSFFGYLLISVGAVTHNIILISK